MKGSVLMITGFTLASLFGCDVRRQDMAVKNDQLQQQVMIKDPTTVQVIDSVYDFGNITEGESVEYNYRFKNTGSKPLVVTSVGASCGCTIPEKPDEPVQPGEIGVIKVRFNSAHHAGAAHKIITVSSNADPFFPELLLKGEVAKKES